MMMTGLAPNPQMRRRTRARVDRQGEEILCSARCNVLRGTPAWRGRMDGSSRECHLCGAQKGDALHYITACPAVKNLLPRGKVESCLSDDPVGAIWLLGGVSQAIREKDEDGDTN